MFIKAEKEMREKYESVLAVLNSSSGDKYQVEKYLSLNSNEPQIYYSTRLYLVNNVEALLFYHSVLTLTITENNCYKRNYQGYLIHFGSDLPYKGTGVNWICHTREFQVTNNDYNHSK